MLVLAFVGYLCVNQDYHNIVQLCREKFYILLMLLYLVVDQTVTSSHVSGCYNIFFLHSISCLFLKNVSPSKRVICFILNNLHFPIVEGIAFYALHKSRVLIIACEADGFCLFIGLPDEI